MPTASSSSLLTVTLGVPITTTTGVTFHGIGTAGTYGALRRLVHPNSSLAPLIYAQNPPVYSNIDTDVLVAPITNTVLTLDDTKVVRFERLQKDMVVEELWPGSRQNPSMTTAFFQMFYEYWKNPPALTGNVGEFIVWEPREKTDDTYQVELVGLILGREQVAYESTEFRAPGGIYKGGSFMNALDGANATETGVLLAPVRLRLKIVAKVP